MQVLAVDIGTTRLKAGRLDLEGRLHRLAVRAIPLIQDGTGRAEHDPEAVWEQFVAAASRPAGAGARALCFHGPPGARRRGLVARRRGRRRREERPRSAGWSFPPINWVCSRWMGKGGR